MIQPQLSIVIPTLDVMSERCLNCIASIRETLNVPYEIVIVDNHASPRGVSEPTNAAMRAISAPYIVFVSDDVLLLGDWWTPLKAALDNGVFVVFPMTVEGFMRYDMAAWIFAFKRSDMEYLSAKPGEFFDSEMAVWYQDTDLLRRLERDGCPPVLVESSHVLHGLSQTIEAPENRDWVQKQIVEDEKIYRSRWP